MTSKIFFIFILLLSMNAFAGQEGNGSDGGLDEAEKRACKVLKSTLKIEGVQDFKVSILNEDELLEYTRDELLRKCCQANNNNC